MVSVKGALDMILNDPSFDKNFRMICWLVLDKLGTDPYYEGRTPKKLAYVIFSAVYDRYSKNNSMMIGKREFRKILGLSPTAAEYTPWGGKNDWAEFRQRIFKIYDDMKSGLYDNLH